MPPPFPSRAVCAGRKKKKKRCVRARDGTMVNRRNQKCDYHSNGDTGKTVILSSYPSTTMMDPADARGNRFFCTFVLSVGVSRN